MTNADRVMSKHVDMVFDDLQSNVSEMYKMGQVSIIATV